MAATPVWEDPRVVEGMRRQLARRRSAIQAGERAIGWKLAFGTAGAMDNLGISGPVVGYLTDATALESGAERSLGGWAKPVLEAELGIHLAQDVPAGSDPKQAAAAIGAIGPAIELADVDRAPDQLTEVIAGDIYHRAVVLAPEASRRAGAAAADLRVAVGRDGSTVERTDEPTAVVGSPGGLVAHVASYLAAFDLPLSAGDAIISGSTVPLIPIAPGEQLRYSLEPLGELSLVFS